MEAHEILDAAAGHLKDRAKTYDKPKGERSMRATVEAFKAVTGVSITETQGWLFMALLKAVRSQQGAFKLDSFEDGAAYFALAGESAFNENLLRHVGALEEKETNEKSPWDNAPEWAQWLAMNSRGLWIWFECKPIIIDGAWAAKNSRFLSAHGNLRSVDLTHWHMTLEPRP